MIELLITNRFNWYQNSSIRTKITCLNDVRNIYKLARSNPYECRVYGYSEAKHKIKMFSWINKEHKK